MNILLYSVFESNLLYFLEIPCLSSLLSTVGKLSFGSVGKGSVGVGVGVGFRYEFCASKMVGLTGLMALEGLLLLLHGY